MNLPASGRDRAFDRLVRVALRLDDGASCVTQLVALAKSDARRQIRILECIDDEFGRIHPRGGTRRAGAVPPGWLRDAEQQRRLHADYAAQDAYRLVARGPLLRAPKDPQCEYRESLVDRFANLRVVDRVHVDDAKRSITIDHRELPQQALFTVTRRSGVGSEQIVFAPLAHGRTEWQLDVCADPQLGQLTVGPASGVQAAQRLLSVLARAPVADIAIAPEFSVPEREGDRLRKGLLALTERAPCLTVAGSGLTEEKDAVGRPWNESRAYNQFGVEVLRQRKLSPSHITADRLREVGVDCNAVRAIEATAAGDTLSITDIPDFGRIAVFICHDIKLQPLTTSVLSDFEPDWVLIPIFDKGFAEGRWSHVEIFGRTNFSPVRFVACASVLWEEGEQFGLAHGPRCSDGVAVERCVALVAAADLESSKDFGEIIWSSNDPRWQQSMLIIKDIDKRSHTSTP